QVGLRILVPQAGPDEAQHTDEDAEAEARPEWPDRRPPIPPLDLLPAEAAPHPPGRRAFRKIGPRDVVLRSHSGGPEHTPAAPSSGIRQMRAATSRTSSRYWAMKSMAAPPSGPAPAAGGPARSVRWCAAGVGRVKSTTGPRLDAVRGRSSLSGPPCPGTPPRALLGGL